jgi:DedD protein
MERKKLLFVAISVGVFLVLAIGAAILVFTPRSSPPAAATIVNPVVERNATLPPPISYVGPGTGLDAPAHPGISQPVDAVDLVRNNADVPGLRPLPDGAGTQGGFHVQGQPAGTVITVPRPSATAVPDTPPAGRAAPQTTQTAQPRPPVQAAPAASPQPAPAATPRPAPAAQRSPAPAVSQPRPAAQTRAHDDFWVQTGAFSTVANAEGVKETLASKGIASIIDNRIIDGRPLFRVRVGPYTSISEANYWLSLIRSIDGFQDSQVRQTQSLR